MVVFVVSNAGLFIHWTQPFDGAVFNSLKTDWNVKAGNFVKETGVQISSTYSERHEKWQQPEEIL